MPVFPSEEWMVEFCQRLEAHPQAAEIARSLDGVYRFVIDPAGPLEQRHVYDVGIFAADAGAEVAVLDDGADPRLTMTTDYRRWQQLVRGELDVGMALMLRRLRVAGDLTQLIGNVSSAGPLLDSLSAVDTVWLEDQ
jgi:hypothetical protein